MSSKFTIPVTIIGYGSSARTFHLPFINSLPSVFRLHSIQQRPGSKSGPDASHAHPGLTIHPSIDAVFGQDASCQLEPLPKGGLAVITIANKLHFQVAKQALLTGRHVLCEKPLALKSEDVTELDKIAKERGLLCSAFQNRRFDGDFLTLGSLFETSNETYLGEPLFFESHFDRFRPLAKGGWREETPAEEGGGILWDLGAHLVDQAVSLFGAPESLLAIVRNSRCQQPASIDDSFHLHLFYPSHSKTLDASAPAAGTKPAGLQCLLSASVLAAQTEDAQLRFKVHATRGSYVKHALDPQENQLRAGQSPGSHPESFGKHAPGASDSERLGTLTIVEEKQRDWLKQPSEPTKPPKLLESKIETRPGRYIDLYTNLADVITKVNLLPETDAQARREILDKQKIKSSQVAVAIRVLELARQSAKEGRVVTFSMV
ncbi:NAD(P)-binding protein [Tilletiaria anomala UBC 951]|uniref:NAD(P)-binding protein n=1 Tax=Tilletiaria anomala (strain ATCC 24038 / CBS 436.72 / UBC 951) TaxID=1037660 RepID=A0A066VGS1_TILAU|nr:NAD(P)-binding protein [Tilletiaria anomala UBC 951]KDN37944.1 NAD(P)-binding protein [Tilletiaria anomala UBC 951]